ncbi:MAG: 50S ribosomal protein L17 [Bacteroidetes bacterium CG02_land_8_20_14_3_00_31_25]|nr:50S ribosomal protein L17 [Bacteroidota bacterium]PIV57785.1 MAG: 50S ribosomal protein L17 [Bacteroidetes bacterium CG02_land_8_20_14_3_00_31_25]
MRHRKNFNHLSRTSSHREALLANMAASLIMHKGIVTTVAKAKALKSYVEPLISRSKEDSTHNRRLVFSYISDKFAVSELFRDIAVKVAQRPGGYTRILRIANRKGDNAELCRLELVDYNENMLATKTETKQRATRTRRGASKKKTTEEVAVKTTKTPKATNTTKTENTDSTEEKTSEAPE